MLNTLKGKVLINATTNPDFQIGKEKEKFPTGHVLHITGIAQESTIDPQTGREITVTTLVDKEGTSYQTIAPRATKFFEMIEKAGVIENNNDFILDIAIEWIPTKGGREMLSFVLA